MTPTIQPEQAGKLEQETRTWPANKKRLLQEAPGEFSSSSKATTSSASLTKRKMPSRKRIGS